MKSATKLFPTLVAAACLGTACAFAAGSENNLPAWTNRPLSMADAINLALQQNGSIQRGKSDLEAQYGVVVQTRAIAIPKLTANGNYQYTDQVEHFPGFPAINNSWTANIQLSQTIYQGGSVQASLRSARLTKEQALLNYQTVIADSLLQVRLAYYDVLLDAELITVEDASIKLLTQQLDDQQRRFDAGTVPRFNVLQAEVAVYNERPKLIQANNNERIAKNNLVNLLGFHLPPEVKEEIPMELTDKLDTAPYDIELPVAVEKALENRSELAAAMKQRQLLKESLTIAGSTYKPSVQIFGAYGARNSQFISSDPAYSIYGGTAGVQASWSIFDGFLTKGKVEQAKSLYQGSQVDIDNEMRDIELEVRTDYNNLIEARETLESQKKVLEEAEEALRLAQARNDAGTGTQLDVLAAQTSLTTARSTQVQAVHDYDTARSRLERAIGLNIMQGNGTK